ncbi:tify domain-containing protein/CCT_2 domain-containing protein [Cephalotus follicularis]|uniref:Protein TIFY n=1 Tax=Cephalotus follicularis TaxID=3775 RepID=A0A1Q3B0W3_CEPFO|nr:tify domain-containing protein/CCT_2 domain-containing protein [Cephalotus follicularis]
MAQEKSSFSQTCSLLSQYLKEKRSFGDINLAMTGKLEAKGLETPWAPPPTMNLLPNLENSSESSSVQNVKSMELLKKIAASGLSTSTEDFTRKPEIMGHGAHQMTILYGGEVLVFDEISEGKAKEIMALALGMDKINPMISSNIVPDLNIVSTSTILRPQANGSGLPIARRASLHRFLEKRKDRVAAKAPYQVNNSNSGQLVSPKPKESNTWLYIEGGQSSNVLELKL